MIHDLVSENRHL